MTTESLPNRIAGIVRDNPRLLAILLRDQSLCVHGISVNILWGTDDYGYRHS